MNEQLKQQIEGWILQDQRRVDKQSHLGLCLLVLQEPSILRHADPEIMKQVGWVREEDVTYAESVCIKSMNDFAKQQIVAFTKWANNSGWEYHSEIDKWVDDHINDSSLRFMTTANLYEFFIAVINDKEQY